MKSARRVRGAGHAEFEQAVGACLFFLIPESALAKFSGLTHGKSRLLLGNKNSLVLPTSTWIKSCRGGSLCPPVFCAAGHTEFEQAVGACLFFHIPASALAEFCGRRWNSPNSGTLLSATQTFPCKGNHTAPTD